MARTTPVSWASVAILGYLTGAIFPLVLLLNWIPPFPALRCCILFPKLHQPEFSGELRCRVLGGESYKSLLPPDCPRGIDRVYLDLVEGLDCGCHLRLRSPVGDYEAELVLPLDLVEGPLGDVGPLHNLLGILKSQLTTLPPCCCCRCSGEAVGPSVMTRSTW